jgi:hypothetical protein
MPPDIFTKARELDAKLHDWLTKSADCSTLSHDKAAAQEHFTVQLDMRAAYRSVSERNRMFS